MSTFEVTVERITVREHPNADALEMAQVGLYRSVVAKGVYHTGDLVVFVPEQAILPAELIEEAGLTGKLAGSAKNRVKAVRLRGELSQGLVMRPELLNVDTFSYEDAYTQRTDLSEVLGISKWVPEVPVHMSGEQMGTTDLLPWVDIENIKRYPNIFEPGEAVVATEKVHGSCTLVTLLVDTDELLVSSKGLSSKNLALIEAESNLYWRVAKEYALKDFAKSVAAAHPEVSAVGIYGEVYGAGIQDLTYGVNGGGGNAPGYIVFDIQIQRREDNRTVWLNFDEVIDLADKFGIKSAPVLFQGGYDEQAIAEAATGKETISGTDSNVREGVVVRPQVERRSDVLQGRAIGKWVSDDYLTRKGGTEYE